LNNARKLTDHGRLTQLILIMFIRPWIHFLFWVHLRIGQLSCT